MFYSYFNTNQKMIPRPAANGCPLQICSYFPLLNWGIVRMCLAKTMHSANATRECPWRSKPSRQGLNGPGRWKHNKDVRRSDVMHPFLMMCFCWKITAVCLVFSAWLLLLYCLYYIYIVLSLLQQHLIPKTLSKEQTGKHAKIHSRNCWQKVARCCAGACSTHPILGLPTMGC